MLLLPLVAAAIAAVPASTLQALEGRSVVLTDTSGAEIRGEITANTAAGVVLITAAGDVVTVAPDRVASVRVANAASNPPPLAQAVYAPSDTFEEGYIDGAEAAKADRARTLAIPGTVGLCAGAACGLFGVPIVAISYALAPADPKRGPWTDAGDEYQDGYAEGYSKTVRRRRLAASVATSLVFGGISTGIALAL